MDLGGPFPRRGSWPYRGGAMPNFVLTEFYEVRRTLPG